MKPLHYIFSVLFYERRWFTKLDIGILPSKLVGIARRYAWRCYEFQLVRMTLKLGTTRVHGP